MSNKLPGLLLLILLASSSFAQSDSSFFDLDKIKLNGGFNFGSAVFYEDGALREDQNYVPGIGLRLGVDYIVPTPVERLDAEIGAALILSRYQLEGQDYDYTNFSFGTHFLANFNLIDRLYFTAGPYVNIGVYGRQTTPSGIVYNFYTANDQQEDPPLNRLDAGLLFRAHYNLKLSLLDDVYMSYQIGLSNIENEQAASGINQAGYNRYFVIGVRSKLTNFTRK